MQAGSAGDVLRRYEDQSLRLDNHRWSLEGDILLGDAGRLRIAVVQVEAETDAQPLSPGDGARLEPHEV